MVKIAHQSPAFHGLDEVYFADTCEPLKAAVSRAEIAMAAIARGHYPGEPLSDGEAPGLQSIGFWDASRVQTWGLDWHRNEGIEITYLARGSLGFAVDGVDYPISAGQLTITRPWQRHRVGSPNVGPSRLHWCILDVGVRRPNQAWLWPEWVGLADQDSHRLTELLQHNEYPVWPRSKEIGDVFESLAHVASNPAASRRESRIRLLVSQLLLGLLEHLDAQRIELDIELSSARRAVRLFLDEIEAHLDHRWSLNDMARRCGLGRTQFARYFQELTNMSPAEYIAQLRMKQAAYLIRTERTLSITDVAMKLGFDSSQYFANRFQKFYRMTPTGYRRTQAAPSLRADGQLPEKALVDSHPPS